MITWTNHRVQIKTHAKISLAGSFLKGVIAALLTLVASVFALYFAPMPVVSLGDITNASSFRELIQLLVPDNASVFLTLCVVSVLLYLLLTAPLTIGKHKFYLLAVRGKKPKFGTILAPFMDLSQVFSACALSVISFVWQIVLSILLFAPSAALYIFSPILGPFALYGAVTLSLVALYFFLILCTPFMLAPFVLADKPENGAFKSILIAQRRLRGAKLEFLVFNFSFALWYLFLGFNGIGSLLLEPYVTASMAGFYDTADACKVKVKI